MDQSPTTEGAELLPTQRTYLWPILALLFAASLAARLYSIASPPFDFHPTRQFRSAILARDLYWRHLDAIPEWQREVARINAERQGIIEPPVTESLAAVAYQIAGGEYLWLPRAFSSLFWVIGGVFLFAIARIWFPLDAAFFAAAFYLLTPYAVDASRSFQPESLMIMLMLLSIWLIVRYHRQPSWLNLALAIAATALTLFIKPAVVFFIFASFTVLTVYKRPFLKSLFRLPVLLFMGLSVLPAFLYYANGLFVAGFLSSQAGLQFVADLPLSSVYWAGWFLQIRIVVGFIVFIGALLGVLVIQPGQSRAFIGALWISYVIYGLVFNYAIATHDYYQLPLIPIVALSLCPLGTAVMDTLARLNYRKLMRASVVVSVVMVSAFLRMQDTRWRVSASDTSIMKIAPAIGEHVKHSVDTLMLTTDYGNPLCYYGDLGGLSWPTSSDFWSYGLHGYPAYSVEERLELMQLNRRAEYFIVTNFGEFEAQTDLRDLLFSHYPVLVQTPEYLIFDLRTKLND